MKKLVALIATLVALAPVNHATHASSSSTFEDSAGAYEGATRMGNATAISKPAPPPPAPAPPSRSLSGPLEQVLVLTNAARAANGLAPLRSEPRLQGAAQAHSEDQARRGQLTHTGSDGSDTGQRIDRTGYRWRTWAENAASGYSTAERVVDGWMKSPGHRANILNPNVTEIGLGVAFSKNGQPYWTQVFAAPR